MVTKKWFSGSLDPKLGIFGVIWGQNMNIFEPTHILYENEALAQGITKKWFLRSPEVTGPQTGGSYRVKLQENMDNLSSWMTFISSVRIGKIGTDKRG